jgi:flavin reductase (DIM6/NTAB) family NADH-FMN oxidoreductase RutF
MSDEEQDDPMADAFHDLNPFLETDEVGDPQSAAAPPDDVRRAFRRMCTGLAVITAAGPHGPVGFTASSVTTVTLDPPTLSFAISRVGHSWEGMHRTGHVGVHLLGAQDADLARRFATSGVDRFAPPVRWAPGLYDVPMLDHGVASLVASVWRRLVIGDHDLVLARILSVTARPDADPLAYYDGRYGTVTALT